MLRKTMLSGVVAAVIGMGSFAGAAPIVMDIANPSNGNNFSGTTTSGPITFNATWVGAVSNLKEIDGTATTIGFQWISYNGLAYLNSIAAGLVTGDAAAIFPEPQARSFWGSPSGNSINFKFTGLAAGTQHELDFFAGHVGGSDVTRFTVTGLNSVSGDLTSGGNLSEILTLGGILPDANGEIIVSVTAAPGSNSLFLNSVRLNAVAVPEPMSLGLIAGGFMLLVRRRSMKA